MLQTWRLIPSPAASVATRTWISPSRNCCSAWRRVPGSSREPDFMPPWMQPTRKPQSLEATHEVVQRVLELGEEEQALVRVVEESFLQEQRFEFRELGLRARILYCLGLDGQAPQLLDLLAHLV